MKLNSDLEKKILQFLENLPPQNDGKVVIDGYSAEEVSYHIKKLSEDGFVKGINSETMQNFEWLATDLTRAGHNRLKEILQDTDTKLQKDLGLIQSRKSCVPVIRNSNLSTIIYQLSSIPKGRAENDPK